MLENVKVDVRYSVFNGLNDYRGIEKFMKDLRNLMIKHNVKYIRSEHMEIDENDILIVRKSEFIGKQIVPMTVESRVDEGTNILYSADSNNYKRAFEIVNKRNQKYEKLVDALKDVLEMD